MGALDPVCLCRDAGRQTRQGDTDKLSAAVTLFERSPRSLAIAAAWEDLGLAHQRHGTADSAIDPLTQALVLFARAGATQDAARLQSSLRALGIRRRVATAENPVTGWAAMTKSELAVAELVANGLTNREIAERLFGSPHTVNTHLRHVFVQLQVHSRVDLTWLSRRLSTPGGTPTPGVWQMWQTASEYEADDDRGCGVRKLDSRGEAVFVDESTEAIAALNIGLWWAHGAPSPALRRIIRTVVAETAMPRPCSSPTIR